MKTVDDYDVDPLLVSSSSTVSSLLLQKMYKEWNESDVFDDDDNDNNSKSIHMLNVTTCDNNDVTTLQNCIDSEKRNNNSDNNGDDDDDDDDINLVSTSQQTSTTMKNTKTTTTTIDDGLDCCSSFEELTNYNDIWCHIVTYVSFHEIVQNVMMCSKQLHQSCQSDSIWKFFFLYRWNVLPNQQHVTKVQRTNNYSKSSTNFSQKRSYDNEKRNSRSKKETHQEKVLFQSVSSTISSSSHWYHKYQRAHTNIHDLWITHWNCTYPDDSLSPGRCYIPPPLPSSSRKRQQPHQQRTVAVHEKEEATHCSTGKERRYHSNHLLRLHPKCRRHYDKYKYQKHKKINQQDDDDSEIYYNNNKDNDHNNKDEWGDPRIYRMALATEQYKQKREQLLQLGTKRIKLNHQNDINKGNNEKVEDDDDDANAGPFPMHQRNSISLLQNERNDAQKAFALASTYYRTLSTQQYELDNDESDDSNTPNQNDYKESNVFNHDNGDDMDDDDDDNNDRNDHNQNNMTSTFISTNFLTDLLFFNITDPITSEGQFEIEQAKHEISKNDGTTTTTTPMVTTKTTTVIPPSTTISSSNSLPSHSETVAATTTTNHNHVPNEDRRTHTTNVNQNVVPDHPPQASTSIQQQQQILLSSPSLYENTNHSWHTIQLYNPHFYLPIQYEFYCTPSPTPTIPTINTIHNSPSFTIYPSQGTIQPGTTHYVTVGVRPMGTVQSYAYEYTNVHRDDDHETFRPQPGIDTRHTTNPATTSWQEYYQKCSHLPMAPIMIRYHYCTIYHPVNIMNIEQRNHNTMNNNNNNNNNNNRDERQQQQQQRHAPVTTNPTTTTRQQMQRTPVQQQDQPILPPPPTHQYRTMYLSTHVHSHYHFYDFLYHTIQPWDNTQTIIMGSPATTSSSSSRFNDSIMFGIPNRTSISRNSIEMASIYGPVYHSPVLQEDCDQTLYHRLQNFVPITTLTTKYSPTIMNNTCSCCKCLNNTLIPNISSTIKKLVDSDPCDSLPTTTKIRRRCYRQWNIREEELYHVYEVAIGEILYHRQQRQRILRNLFISLNVIVTSSFHNNNFSFNPSSFLSNNTDNNHNIISPKCTQQYHVASLLYSIHGMIQSFKATPYLSNVQTRILIQLETIIDQMYQSVSLYQEQSCQNTSNSKSNIPHTEWRRQPGSYRYKLCTDSVYIARNPCTIMNFQNNSNDTITTSATATNPNTNNAAGTQQGENFVFPFQVIWKEEPSKLNRFRSLAHHPGWYKFGPQIDPNHPFPTRDENSLPSSLGRDSTTSSHTTSDIFLNNIPSFFRAGFCLIHDPESFLVHGIYERIPYPGTVIRRPKIHYHLEAMDQLLKPMLQQQQFMTHNTNDGFITPVLITSEERLNYYFVQNSFDVQSIMEVDGGLKIFDNSSVGTIMDFLPFRTSSLSMSHFLLNVPPPGMGRYTLSTYRTSSSNNENTNEVVPFIFDERVENRSILYTNGKEEEMTEPFNTTQHQNNNNDNMAQHPDPVQPDPGGRFFSLVRLLRYVGDRFGLIQSNSTIPSVPLYIDRTILIAAQWLAISCMVVPIGMTLLARYAGWIPTQPVEYYLHGLPFKIRNKLRYLTGNECGAMGLFLLSMSLVLGRWNERNTHRDYLRVMRDHVISTPLVLKQRHDEKGGRKRIGFLSRTFPYVREQMEIVWDILCPLCLQRLLFLPSWNRRGNHEVWKHLVHWRSRNIPEQKECIRIRHPNKTTTSKELLGDSRDEGIRLRSDMFVTKWFIALFVGLGSFCSCSSHFWLNVVAIYSLSIGLGISTALYDIEKENRFLTTTTRTDVARSFSQLVKEPNVVAIVLFWCLAGQLVGCSGGIMFLAEFIVTAANLLLGGIGAISNATIESWICFGCFLFTSIWGYLLGNTGMMNVTRTKMNITNTNKRSPPSAVLSITLLLLGLLWCVVFSCTTFHFPFDHVVVRIERNKPDNDDYDDDNIGINLARMLQ